MAIITVWQKTFNNLCDGCSEWMLQLQKQKRNNLKMRGHIEIAGQWWCLTKLRGKGRIRHLKLCTWLPLSQSSITQSSNVQGNENWYCFHSRSSHQIWHTFKHVQFTKSPFLSQFCHQVFNELKHHAASAAAWRVCRKAGVLCYVMQTLAEFITAS